MPSLAPPAKTVASLGGRLLEVALGYQGILATNPRNPQALAAMSLIALASRQPRAAVELASAAVREAPRMVTAWITLGQALNAAAQFAESQQAYLQALRLDGAHALTHLGLGELKLATSQPAEAFAEFELALRSNPTLVAAHLGLGNACAVTGRNHQALDCYERALELQPRLADGEFAAGFVLARLGRIKEAETRYRRALVRRPDFAAAWMNLGSLLREQGREVYAEAALLRAVGLRPDLVAGWINLAMLERERRRPAEAEAYLQKALALNPHQVETHISWCQFCAGQLDYPAAWRWVRSAQALDPAQPEAINMEGILLHGESRYPEAIAAFLRAEQLGHHAACSNRGNALLDLGRMEQALAAHQAAVDRDPAHPGAQYNLALTQLRLGHWEQGWRGYEARWHFREVHRQPRTFPQPRWHGEPLPSSEPLAGRRILLHAEQGLGDTLQFCRYATLVAARGGYPILQVQPPVERLLRSLAVVRAGQAEVALLGSSPPAFDLECPLMSLPAVFETTPDSVPWPGAYLGADPRLIADMRLAFPDVRHSPGIRPLRIGLAWAGNPRYKADAQRSMPFTALLPLLQAPNVTWISLQKGPAAEQLDAAAGSIFVWDGCSRDRDLAETAALAATLDLVITTDTCIAHLAGALGKPVWILLPHLADWRWMQDSETTPWYPTARLLRQPSRGDWNSVVSRAHSDLAAFQRSFQPRPPRHPPALDQQRHPIQV